jgi:hypothetical protein
LGISLAARFKVLLEGLVERRQRFLVVRFAVLDLVELRLHARGVLDVQNVVEHRMQQLVHEAAPENRRPELALDLVHVIARLQHRNDRRVGARTADAVFFERFHQRSFVEARRRLRELLLGLQLLQFQRLPFRQDRQHARLRRLVVSLGRPGGFRGGLFGPLAFFRFVPWP